MLARRHGVGGILLAHVVLQRAAAADALHHHDLDAVAVEHADRGLVDGRVEHLLGAAGEQADALDAGARRRVHRRPAAGSGGGQGGRRHREHGVEALGEEGGHRLGQHGAAQRQPEAGGVGQDAAEHGPRQPVHERATVGLGDVRARVVDEVHVVHAGRAGRHAGEAGQAAVDVLDRLGIGRAVVLQHVLHQVDAAARRVVLLAEQHEGRAGRGAEAAMHAFADDLLAGGEGGLLEEVRREVGLHDSALEAETAPVEEEQGIEAGLHPTRQRRERAGLRLEHGRRRAHGGVGAHQRGVAAVPGERGANGCRRGRRRLRGRARRGRRPSRSTSAPAAPPPCAGPRQRPRPRSARSRPSRSGRAGRRAARRRAARPRTGARRARRGRRRRRAGRNGRRGRRSGCRPRPTGPSSRKARQQPAAMPAWAPSGRQA